MSFHQDQRYADGTVWYTAVDLVARNPGTVHRAPRVDECPQQGSAEAKRWGVHINTSESWHIQPIENDGYQTWVNAGRKRPVPGYPIPNEGTSPSPPTHSPIPYDPQEDDMAEKILVRHVNGQMYVTDMVSYANACDEDEGERLRDTRGAKADPKSGGGPFPLDQQDSDWVARIAN
jgi:hypothetical protein